MKIMISQPMGGLTDEEINKVRNTVKSELEQDGHEVVDTFFDGPDFEDSAIEALGIKNRGLYFLAKSLEELSKCDGMFFVRGWEDARGCVIENAAAEAYGLEMLGAVGPEAFDDDISEL